VQEGGCLRSKQMPPAWAGASACFSPSQILDCHEAGLHRIAREFNSIANAELLGNVGRMSFDRWSR
jgi:hypothetical protein